MIAIIGATGYIGKSLARELVGRRLDEIVLFARNPDRLQPETWPTSVCCIPLDRFDARAFDLVINAVGAGDPLRVAEMGATILSVTQYWDDMILSTMGSDTCYVFLSSGAVYGGTFERPVGADSILSIPVNRIQDVPPYTMSKLYAEAKHRAYIDRAILDIRIFGYADESIDRKGRFFLSNLARSVIGRIPFETSSQDMEFQGQLIELIPLRLAVACMSNADIKPSKIKTHNTHGESALSTRTFIAPSFYSPRERRAGLRLRNQRSPWPSRDAGHRRNSDRLPLGQAP